MKQIIITDCYAESAIPKIGTGVKKFLTFPQKILEYNKSLFLGNIEKMSPHESKTVSEMKTAIIY